MPHPATGLVQLSDVHLRIGPRDGESARRLEATVRAVSDLSVQPHSVLLSGDLVDVATERAYERLRELLAPLEMPLHAIPGNHDDRELMRAASLAPADDGTGAEPVRFALDCGGMRVLACDSTRPGRPDGRLDDVSLAWLDASLATGPDMPTLVAMHHPPVDTGIRAIDAIGLAPADRAALGELVARHPQVRSIAAGHVHRAMAGRLGAVPVLVCPGISSHLALDLDPGHDWTFTDAAPGYAFHALVTGEIASHVERVEAAAPRPASSD